VDVTAEVFEKLQEENKKDLIDTLNIDENPIPLLKRQRDMYSRNDTDIGQCSSIKHRID